MQVISDVIKPRDIYWVNADDSVRQAVHYLCERKTGAVAVKDGDEVVGVFSERDLMHRVVNVSLDLDTVRVRQVMTPDPISIRLDGDLGHAKSMMLERGVRHLVVVGNGGVFKGLISMRDLIDVDMVETSELIERLNDVYYEKAYQARWRMSSNRTIVEQYIPQ